VKKRSRNPIINPTPFQPLASNKSVRESETAIMNAGNSEQFGSAAAYETAGTTTAESPHYVILTLTGSDTGAGQGVHPTYVNYVEGAADQTIYATTDGQIWYPEYMVGEAGTMHAAAPGNTTAVADSQMESNLTQGTTEGQLLAQGNDAYLTKQGFNSNTALALTATQPVTADVGGEYCMVDPGNTTINPPSLDGDGHSDLSLTLTSTSTIQWLWQNFEVVQDARLPCSTMYNHYLRHCYKNKLVPLNETAFGKIIRLVFVGLTTRRLGARGKCKYHYYGIGVKPGSLLNQLSEERKSSVRQQLAPQKLYKLLSGSHGSGTGTQKRENQCEQNTSHLVSSNNFNSQQQHHHQYPGDGSVSMPDFPDVEFPLGSAIPVGFTVGDVVRFRNMYREHCEAFLKAVMNLEFWTIESLWREFWGSHDNNGDECEKENYLSKRKLHLLCKFEPVQQFVRRVDYPFYQKLVELLIPDVLTSLPNSLTQAILKFTSGLESWLTGAMTNCPEEMTHVKVSAVSAFAQTLRRYTSLNHMAQAARPVLQNSSQIDQMLAGINQIDFRNAQEQASWVCQCDGRMLQQLEADFKMALHQQNSLEQWAAWLKGVVTQALKPYEGKPNFAEAAKQFLIRWSFYNSVVIRDLTFRSSASFGSLYLIRLLYDEYMFFLIEHQVALETGQAPITILGRKNNNPSNVASSNPSPKLGVSLSQLDLMSLLE
jgi:regulatory factor X 1/2/3